MVYFGQCLMIRCTNTERKACDEGFWIPLLMHFHTYNVLQICTIRICETEINSIG